MSTPVMNLAIPLAELEQMKGLANLLPGDPAEAFAKMMLGRGMGMDPAQALAQIDWVKNKAEMSANAQAARLRSYIGPWGERYDYEVQRLDNEECVLVFTRLWPDRGPDFLGESVFTMEDARTAGIANQMYTKYARNMLLSRAMSNGVAWFAPETTYGARVYSLGEIDPSREHPVPELPDGVLTAPQSGAQGALPAAVPEIPAEAKAAAAYSEAARKAQDAPKPAAADADIAPTGGPPTQADYQELRDVTDERGLSDEQLHHLLDNAGVPAGSALKARLKAANRGQVVSVISRAQFTDGEPAKDGGPETVDSSAADDPAPGPAEAVTA